jgi:hypothetical protein
MKELDQTYLWLMFKRVMPIPVKRIFMIFIQNAYVTFQNQFIEKKGSICTNCYTVVRSEANYQEVV